MLSSLYDLERTSEIAYFSSWSSTLVLILGTSTVYLGFGIEFMAKVSLTLLKEVAVRKVKEFEAHFLLEMSNKLPNVLAEFKKGNLPEDGLKQMVELANSIIPQYK